MKKKSIKIDDVIAQVNETQINQVEVKTQQKIDEIKKEEVLLTQQKEVDYQKILSENVNKEIDEPKSVKEIKSESENSKIEVFETKNVEETPKEEVIKTEIVINELNKETQKPKEFVITKEILLNHWLAYLDCLYDISLINKKEIEETIKNKYVNKVNDYEYEQFDKLMLIKHQESLKVYTYAYIMYLKNLYEYETIDKLMEDVSKNKLILDKQVEMY